MNREEPQQKLHRVNLLLIKEDKDKLKRLAARDLRKVNEELAYLIRKEPETKTNV